MCLLVQRREWKRTVPGEATCDCSQLGGGRVLLGTSVRGLTRLDNETCTGKKMEFPFVVLLHDRYLKVHIQDICRTTRNV